MATPRKDPADFLPHGGPQPNSGPPRGIKHDPTGKATGVAAVRQRDIALMKAAADALGISHEIQQMNPLQIIMTAARHYAAAGEWAIAASCARDAAPYYYPKQVASKTQHADMADTATLSDAELHQVLRRAA